MQALKVGLRPRIDECGGFEAAVALASKVIDKSTALHPPQRVGDLVINDWLDGTVEVYRNVTMSDEFVTHDCPSEGHEECVNGSRNEQDAEPG